MDNKNRICHLTSVHKPKDVRIFHKECTSLANHGFDVNLIATNARDEIANNVRIIGVKGPREKRLARMTKMVHRVYEKAIEADADIYHLHDPELLRIVRKLKKRGKKVVYDAHEDLPKQILKKHWVPLRVRKPLASIIKLYENRISAIVDLVIAATPSIAKRFKMLNANTVDVNNYPLLTEMTVKQSGSYNKKKEICYFGGISQLRGISYLVKALGKTTVKLNLVGSYSPQAYREELLKLPEWNRVIELGWVDRAQLHKTANRCIAGVVTYQPAPNNLEALPNKLFEYMAFGIPVIASNFPHWREIVEGNECGICVNPEDPHAIANAINELTLDIEKANIMGIRGQKLIREKYNWEKESNKLIKSYKML